jgi:serine protease
MPPNCRSEQGRSRAPSNHVGVSSHHRIPKTVAGLAALAAAVLAVGPGGSAASAASASASAAATPTVGAPHILWPAGQSPTATPPSPTQYNDLIFHGGAVEHQPAVYLVFWGTEWQKGFSTGDTQGTYTSAQAQKYIRSFFAGVGGSPWNGTQTQYCDNINPGSVTCQGQAYPQYINNPTRILKGVWVDPSPVPATIVTSGLAENITLDPIAQEAANAANHFGYNIDATYMILTPPGHAATAYGSVYCAYHSEVTNIGGHGVKYAFIPYVMEQGAGCGQYGVNAKADAFGHGFFDSYSIVSGHEFAEAETDPDAFPTQDGWNDYQTSENGDKCAYFHMQNITLGGNYYAVQPLWSNEANAGTGGCAVSRGTGAAPVPPVTPV